MEAIDPELRDLQLKYENLLEKYAELSTRIAKTQGEVAEIKHVSASFTRSEK